MGDDVRYVDEDNADSGQVDTIDRKAPLNMVMTEPWKLRVDWTCQDAYGDEVVVELHVMGEEPVVLRRLASYAGAFDSAVGYMADRGFDYWCNLPLHEREQHKHVTLHPVPKGRTS